MSITICQHDRCVADASALLAREGKIDEAAEVLKGKMFVRCVDTLCLEEVECSPLPK